MNYVFINYPKCSTCQKAKKFLDKNNIKYTDRHIVTDTPTYEELKNIIYAFDNYDKKTKNGDMDFEIGLKEIICML